MAQSDFSEDFRGNKQLKAPNVKEYVSPDVFKYRIEEFKRIQSDITYFAEKYFYIISLDKGKGLIKLYPKQAELVKTMASERRVITLACRQCGKCVSGNTYISIRNKKTGKIEDITIKKFFDRFKDQLNNVEIQLKIEK